MIAHNDVLQAVLAFGVEVSLQSVTILGPREFRPNNLYLG